LKKKLIIFSIILIIIISLSVLLYPTIKNKNYKKNLLNIIYKNTEYREITYLNKDNNYYIIKTNTKVIVLDLNYEEISSIGIDKLSQSNLELVYRRNKLYYEEKKKEKNKVIYKFYDVETNKLEYETSLGGN